LIIDLPPGTGDEPLSIAQLIPGNFAIIVTTPQDVALLDARKAVSFSRRLNMKVLGIVENMSGMRCPKCGEKIDLFKIGGGKNAANELGVPFLGAIPIDPDMVKDGDKGVPFIQNHKDSNAAKAIAEIVKNIKKLLETDDI
jgi:Mrp family chromosome partitioning ATPase